MCVCATDSMRKLQQGCFEVGTGGEGEKLSQGGRWGRRGGRGETIKVGRKPRQSTVGGVNRSKEGRREGGLGAEVFKRGGWEWGSRVEREGVVRRGRGGGESGAQGCG